MTDNLLLKWGTLKGWNLESDAAREALQKYIDAGKQALSAMLQHDTDAQQSALCALIDTIDGVIQNDWTGETMCKDEAKKYVMEYSR